MKTTIDLWHKVWPDPGAFVRASAQDLERFEALVRADQRAVDARLCKGVIELYRGTAMGKHAEIVGDDCAGAILYTGEPND
jgi:hypothetical protein